MDRDHGVSEAPTGDFEARREFLGSSEAPAGPFDHEFRCSEAPIRPIDRDFGVL